MFRGAKLILDCIRCCTLIFRGRIAQNAEKSKKSKISISTKSRPNVYYSVFKNRFYSVLNIIIPNRPLNRTNFGSKVLEMDAWIKLYSRFVVTI